MAENLPADRFLVADLVRWREPRRGRFTQGTTKAKDRVHELAVGAGSLLVRELSRQSPRSRVHRGEGPRFADAWRDVVTNTPTGAQLRIDNTSPQRGYVIFPTRAHGPKHARILHWIDDSGHDVWARRVRGTPANDVLGRVMAGSSGRLRDALQKTTVQTRQHIIDVWM